jgi:hypothetical protein
LGKTNSAVLLIDREPNRLFTRIENQRAIRGKTRVDTSKLPEKSRSGAK